MSRKRSAAGWLNMAESARAILAGQCHGRRIPDLQTLAAGINAWQSARNKNNPKADWRFTADNARIKRKSLYPVI